MFDEQYDGIAVSFWSVREMKNSPVFKQALAEELALKNIEIENLRAIGLKVLGKYDESCKEHAKQFDCLFNALVNIASIPNQSWSSCEAIEDARKIAKDAIREVVNLTGEQK